jgi:Flp pilus assembly pilin Flp
VETRCSRFLRDESGATTLEYSLFAAGLFLAIATVVGSLGGQLRAPVETITN